MAKHPRLAANLVRAIPFVLAVLTPLEAGALRTGDLLVLDGQNNRVLRVDTRNGIVTTFSPRSGTNLLNTQPRSIAVDPADGEIVVLNGNTPALVTIDPSNGDQFAMPEASQGSLLLGPEPSGLAMSPRAPGFGSFRTLFVSEAGAVHVIDRNLLGATATLLSSYPSPDEFDVGDFAAVRDPGGGNPLDVFVETSQKILVHDGSTMSEYWTVPQTTLQGLGYDPDRDRLMISLRYASCPSDYNGVYYFQLAGSLTPPNPGFGDLTPVQTGDNLACAGPIALSSAAEPGVIIPPFPVFMVDAGSIPPRIIEITEPGVNHVAATLPEGSSATAVAVYTPEPSSRELAPTTAVVLAALGHARARRGRRDLSPSVA
jgi:hypothetical protein